MQPTRDAELQHRARSELAAAYACDARAALRIGADALATICVSFSDVVAAIGEHRLSALDSLHILLARS